MSRGSRLSNGLGFFRVFLFVLGLGSFGLSCYAYAAFDEYADDFAPNHFTLRTKDLTLSLKGKLEIELHDIEGQGGPGFDSPTDTRTIGTRSPFVEIDGFWLALRLGLGRYIGVNSVLEFSPQGARISAAWFEARVAWPSFLTHTIEVGFNLPFVQIDRRTERYPLIATSYWRSSEFHAIYEGRLRFSPSIALEIGLSLAIMRPLAFFGIQDSTSLQTVLNLLAYGPARVFSGNAPVFGAKLHFEAYGAYITAFGFLGELASEAGTDELRSNFANYPKLPGYNNSDPLLQDRSFFWAGGRIGYKKYGVNVLVEAIASKESLLSRVGGYAQASYALSLWSSDRLFHTFELLIRAELYRLLDSTTTYSNGFTLRQKAPSQSVTWDYHVLTLALIVSVYRDILRLRLEYTFLEEINGVPEHGLPHEPVQNNEFVLQVELRF